MRTPESFAFEVDSDGVATITLDRADKLNALTFQVYREATDLFRELEHEEAVKAVVITGRGRAFCSGGDVEDIIGELLKYDGPGLLRFTRMTGELINNIRRLRKPVIAAINGVAAGAGAVIATASDFRLMVPESKFAFLFVRVGLAGADMGAAYLLPRIVGQGRANEILMLGDSIAAQRCLEIGLANQVVDASELMPAAQALALRLAQGPRFAIGMTKELLNQEACMSLDQAIEAEAQAQQICMQTKDFHEAFDAFVNKRKPNFTGR